jgi:hypothetical protein
LSLQQTSTAKQTDSGRTTADKKLLTCAKYIDVFHRKSSFFVDKKTGPASRGDENVVKAGGKVVNALNQAAMRERLKRFSQKLEQFFPVVSAESELCPILQKY